MPKAKVRFLKDVCGYNTKDVTEVYTMLAAQLVNLGYCKVVKEREQKKPKKSVTEE